MIDWKKPLTLCWCGFEFKSLNYRQPRLQAMAEEINEIHIRVHRINERTERLREMRRIVEQLMPSPAREKS